MDLSEGGKIVRGNLEAIRLAQKGSDLYGVLEKTAFFLHTMRPDKNQDDNWFDAQQAIALDMADESYLWQSGRENPAGFISEFLKRRADEISKLVRTVNRITSSRGDGTGQYVSEKPDDIWEITRAYFASTITEVYMSVSTARAGGPHRDWYEANRRLDY